MLTYLHALDLLSRSKITNFTLRPTSPLLSQGRAARPLATGAVPWPSPARRHGTEPPYSRL